MALIRSPRCALVSPWLSLPTLLLCLQAIKWLAVRPALARMRGSVWWRHAAAALAALNITGARGAMKPFGHPRY